MEEGRWSGGKATAAAFSSRCSALSENSNLSPARSPGSVPGHAVLLCHSGGQYQYERVHFLFII
jgi:hypothetical protein